jgi:hypothetical protein
MSNKTISITLTGEVTPTHPERDGWFWLYYSADEYSEIELDALTECDRNLVERKLREWYEQQAIEEENIIKGDKHE